jgi:N-acetylmuramoyl-L-alanine amidase
MRFGATMRWVRCAGCVAGCACLATGLCGAVRGAPASTPVTAKAKAAQKKIVALNPWEQAERARETLEAIPDEARTKADYARAMDLYRAIYHANPRNGHAPPAVNAVAEMLAEQGRTLHDAKSSKAAVGQYEFLRTQYPGSSLGAQALLAEGEIAQNDLGDKVAARERYSLLLKMYGKSAQVEEARAGLASLKQGPADRVQGSAKSAAPTVVAEPAHRDTAAMNGAPSVVPVTGSGLPPMGLTAGVAAVDMATLPSGLDAKAAKKAGERAMVTGIRHWSTATYTRVAIDLGDGVTYEASRVPNPDRIYFDLHGTRLSAELVGKSFAVTDDGFLKKIRAAQFSDDMTRVVLDVSDVSEYSAFLLPNPYRLIIDIHGKAGAREQVPGFSMPVEVVPVSRTASVGRPTMARPVPNTVTTKNAAAATDVADLSDLPGRVEATSKPTSKPISAVVRGEPTLRDTSAKDGPSGVAVPGSTTRTDPTLRAAAAKDGPPAVVAVPDLGKKTHKGKAAVLASAPGEPARPAVPTADGETSLVRALGLKIGRIVIDAGHGGHDSGTLGVDGIMEKDVVLDVALRLGRMLHERLGAEIIYTRSDDTFIPLETRTAIANKAQADLFLSIHANSSPDAAARGVETYYLNFTSDPAALEVAARENAVGDQSVHQLSDLVKKIALKDKIAESREFAGDVEASLYGGLQKGNAGLKDRGVKKAPFVVLIGANMPSILAEISFVTNAKDAGQLRDPEYRQRVAESLYKGVARYEGGLSGPKAVPIERAAR